MYAMHSRLACFKKSNSGLTNVSIVILSERHRDRVIDKVHGVVDPVETYGIPVWPELWVVAG